MDQKQQILHHYRVDEDGLREISRKVGVGRKSLNGKSRLLNLVLLPFVPSLSTETALFVDNSFHFKLLSMKRWLFVDRNAKQPRFSVDPRKSRVWYSRG